MTNTQRLAFPTRCGDDVLAQRVQQLEHGIESGIIRHADHVTRSVLKLFEALDIPEGDTDTGVYLGEIDGDRAYCDVLVTVRGEEWIVETKRPDENLADHVEQLLDYCRGRGVRRGFITNGKEFWFYEDEKKIDTCYTYDPHNAAATLRHHLAPNRIDSCSQLSLFGGHVQHAPTLNIDYFPPYDHPCWRFIFEDASLLRLLKALKAEGQIRGSRGLDKRCGRYPRSGQRLKVLALLGIVEEVSRRGKGSSITYRLISLDWPPVVVRAVNRIEFRC